VFSLENYVSISIKRIALSKGIYYVCRRRSKDWFHQAKPIYVKLKKSNMSILNQILERSKENKELIGLWKYKDDESFWCGFVIDFNETLVKIQHFTKYGKPDGIIIAQISEIQNVDFNDDYAKAMQCVIDYSKELEKEDKINLIISEGEDWDFDILKQMEGDFEKITSVEINSSDYFSGFILEVSESDFILNCVGKLGQDEGTVVYRIEDVTGFRINDIDNRKRAMLYKWRKASLQH
jgi:hypothetical protein